MKKILLDGNKNFYKANLHCHSTKSDGNMTVEELKEHYKKNGYSVIAFTDHEHLVNNSHLNDDNFLAITSSELAIKEIENMSTLVKWDMKVCHLNIYAKDENNIKTPCYNFVLDKYITEDVKDEIYQPDKTYKRDYSPEAIAKIVDICNKEGFLVCYNHPRWSLENATDYLGYKNLWAVEIYNNEASLSGLYEYDINVYDDFLRDGQRIACTMADDNHSINTTLGGFVMLNAEKLEYKTIMTALENHSFYSSTGPLIKNLYIEDDKAYLTYEKGCYAVMCTKGRRVEKQVAENENGENVAVFNIRPDDGYIRFDVVDKFGKRANTNAYFLDMI